MRPHATCSRCSMTLVSTYIDGQRIDVCPRSSCEGHDPKLATSEALTDDGRERERAGDKGMAPARNAPTRRAA